MGKEGGQNNADTARAHEKQGPQHGRGYEGAASQCTIRSPTHSTSSHTSTSTARRSAVLAGGCSVLLHSTPPSG
jgi:hypothetical protein